MNLTKNQELKYDIYKTLHECPWYRRFFPKKIQPDKHVIGHRYPFIFKEVAGPIGNWHTMQCEKCGKVYDITDYDLW